ncbi:hypothetical protein ONZ45_g16918 [Pleurotus djamor]|nr:hypothetical protein ONZ45_g16918 [Pleurotus djamor]
MPTSSNYSSTPTGGDSEGIRSDGASIGITELRRQIGNQMDTEFIETDFTTFALAYMPFVPEEHYIDNVMKRIRKETMNDLGSRFRDFLDVPHVGVDTEASYFSGLLKIAEAIGQVPPPPGRERNEFEFRHCPTTQIGSSIPGSNNLIDACIIRKSSASLHDQAISCPLEFKIKKTPKLLTKNNLQITSASIQIMNDDPRRMFTYGITIIADAVTSWYFSRSHSAVSESFSIVEVRSTSKCLNSCLTNDHKEPRKFVKLLISFFFSNEEELGYDPNVERDAEGRYIFTLPQESGPPRRFLTKTSISEYRSNTITGRMTRVWLVTEHWDDPHLTAVYVLKDVWLSISDRTEKQIQMALFAGIDEFFQSDPRNHPLCKDEALKMATPSFEDVIEQRFNYKDYFMTIVTDHRGRTSKAVADPAWRKTGLFSTDLPTHVPTSRQSRAIERAPTGETPRPLEGQALAPTAYRSFAKRRQYRVVFKEFCTDVGSLNTLGEVADVLEQTLFALRLMLCAGWVHRDISCGNILALKNSDGTWQAKLSDLEYAKKYPPHEGSSASHDPKTGTAYFMPVEVSLSTFFYNPPTVALSYDQVAPTITPPIVIHNFQHDLESLFWIFLWSSTLRTHTHLSAHDSYFRKVFIPQIKASDDRLQCIRYKLIPD